MIKKIKRILKEKYICFEINIKGWKYYLDCMWDCHYYQGKTPWIVRVHPKCQDIQGWRFGWREISICWGRYLR
jgi:hypothetical protein